MANIDQPRGLSPARHLGGKPFNGGTWKCYCATGNASALYIGDPIIHEGSACTNGCCMTIAIATAGAGNEVLGAIVSFDPLGPTAVGFSALSAAVDRSGSPLYRVASTARYANVCIDPDVIYDIQGDSAGVHTKDQVGENADLVAGTGSTVTGRSGWELNSATDAVTKNLQLHVIGAVDHPGNDISLVNADWYVLLNTTVFGPGTLGRVLGVD